MKVTEHFVATLALVVLAAGCAGDAVAPGAGEALAARTMAPAPAPQLQVAFGGQTLTIWPFTAGDAGGGPSDPVNLLFVGSADPRSLRAALLLLDGNRTGFGLPDVFPFNCTWSDAAGGVQAAWTAERGWRGSAVQLQCGSYDPIRFHLRLFPAGAWTLGGAHFEVLIPGTTDHQVLSWEVAEQLVVIDMLRTGILDGAVPLMPSAVIHPAPSFREIPAIIYNGIPLELRAAIGGPPGDVTSGVGILTDGRATIFNVAAAVNGQPGVFREVQTITFNQVIPKPFCSSGPFDYLLVQGPVELRNTVVLSAGGALVSTFQAVGHLDVTPVNPLADPPEPLGETYRALVVEHHQVLLNDVQQRASNFTMQIEIPARGTNRGSLRLVFDVRDGRLAGELRVACTP
jgi:hypothetical protein